PRPHLLFVRKGRVPPSGVRTSRPHFLFLRKGTAASTAAARGRGRPRPTSGVRTSRPHFMFLRKGTAASTAAARGRGRPRPTSGVRTPRPHFLFVRRNTAASTAAARGRDVRAPPLLRKSNAPPRVSRFSTVLLRNSSLLRARLLISQAFTSGTSVALLMRQQRRFIMVVLLVILTFCVMLLIDHLLFRQPVMIEEGTARPAKRPRLVASIVAGFEVPDNLRYHPGHTWAVSETPDLVRVGIDDLAAKVAGKLAGISIPERGQWIRQGQKIIAL